MSSSGGGGVSRLEQAATNTTKSKSPMKNKRFMAAKVAFFLATPTKKASHFRDQPKCFHFIPCAISIPSPTSPFPPKSLSHQLLCF
jgi:hypothetical protein